jgi:Tol biopolymer transport system component
MLALIALLCVAPDDLALRIRHLDSVAQAWSPAPSTDGTRVAFLTTLFGTRQAASMAADGSYPTQLTDEPEGVRAVRWVPGPAKELLVLAMRGGHERLVIVDEQGTAPIEVEGAGDQLWGGFTRDGKRLYYATVDGAGKAVLRIYALDTHKAVDLAPPPPAAKAVIPKDTVPLEDALKGLVSLGPISPDQRSLLATSKRAQGEVLYSIDLSSTRAMQLTPEPGHYRLPHYTPDNKNVYVWTDQGRDKAGVDLLTIANRSRKTIYLPAAGELSAFAVSNDGHRLVVAVESGGETLFSLLDLPSLRAQPLAAPPSGALAKSDASEPPIIWDRTGERLFFGWRLANDTTDIWELRLGYGQALRLTRSPRPGLPRDAIPRAAMVKVPSGVAWMWMPEGVTKPKVAVLASAHEVQPVFDKRIAALNFAGFAVLAVQGQDAQKVALDYLRSATAVDGKDPLLLDWDGEGVQEPSRWSGVVGPRGAKGAGLTLDVDQPDLHALVKYALRNGRAGG